MAHSRAESQAARRRFLIKTLGLGAAGLAAGGGAAWAKGEVDSLAHASVTIAALQAQLQATGEARAAAELAYATLQTQAADWQARLTAANAQNAQLATALTNTQQELTALQSHLAAVAAERDLANQKLARSSELVGLYERLEAVGLDGLMENGLSTMGALLSGLSGPADLLRNGVDGARGLLAGFERTLPSINEAMGWLGEQVVRLKVGLWAVETAAQRASNSAVAGLASAFAGFAGFVLDHLPFNIGAKVRSTLDATQSVLTNVTAVTDNAADKVLLRVSRYVDDGPQNWGKTLAQPLRDTTLAPADSVLEGVATAGSTFESALRAPAATALEQRRALREQIAAFRAAHGL